MLKSEIKNMFENKGYFVVRNLLSNNEVTEFSKEIDKLYDLEYKKNIKVRMGIHPYEKFWSIINNKKLIDSLNKIFDKKFNFLYQAGILQTIEGKEYLHHRDNPCRKFGVGPDWEDNSNYKIARVGIYLQNYAQTKFHLNLIPYSHKKKYSIREFFRFFHKKTRYLNKIRKLRNIFPKYFGNSIKTNPGDCIIFDPRIYHSPSPHSGKRQAIFLSYGEDNQHSDNYITYFTKLRSGMEYSSIGENFFQFLNEKNLYKPLNPEITSIEGAFTKELDRDKNKH
jgi:hypothetical protein